MSIIFNRFSSSGLIRRTAAALFLVYVVWGTTYFAIGVALKEMPPLWLNTSRFVTAGLLEIVLARHAVQFLHLGHVAQARRHVAAVDAAVVANRHKRSKGQPQGQRVHAE